MPPRRLCKRRHPDDTGYVPPVGLPDQVRLAEVVGALSPATDGLGPDVQRDITEVYERTPSSQRSTSAGARSRTTGWPASSAGHCRRCLKWLRSA